MRGTRPPSIIEYITTCALTTGRLLDWTNVAMMAVTDINSMPIVNTRTPAVVKRNANICRKEQQ
eukprot:5049160-Amphidinium_carterae.1